MRAVSPGRLLAFAAGTFLLSRASELPVHADTIYLRHGEKVEGRILHIEEGESGIQFIRIETATALITVPGRSIDHYEDIPEATSTPIPTVTSTATPTPTPHPTRMPRPTWTPLPSPTPHIRPEIPPQPGVPWAPPPGEETWDKGQGDRDLGRWGIGALFALLILYCVLLLFMIVSLWRVYTKAGRPGWAILIPIYSFYVFLKIAGKPGWWIFLALIPFVNSIVAILVTVGIARNFGKGVGFAIGLIFLPLIFYPILAFGSAEYRG